MLSTIVVIFITLLVHGSRCTSWGDYACAYTRFEDCGEPRLCTCVSWQISDCQLQINDRTGNYEWRMSNFAAIEFKDFKFSNEEVLSQIQVKNTKLGNYPFIDLKVMYQDFTELTSTFDIFDNRGLKIDHLTLKGLGGMPLDQVQNAIGRVSDTLETLVLVTCFKSDSTGVLDLSSFAFQRLATIDIRDLGGVEVKLPEVVKTVSNFDSYDPNNDDFSFMAEHHPTLHVLRTKMVTEQVHVYLSQVHTSQIVDWENYNLYPLIFAEKNDPNTLNQLDLRGPGLFSKEILQFCPFVNSLSLQVRSSIVRIEYGSLAVEGRLFFRIIGENWVGFPGFAWGTDVSMDEDGRKDLFLKGDCAGLVFSDRYGNQQIYLCQVCIMHQYQLHRDNDNTADLCKSGKNPSGGVKMCYWTQPQPLPPPMSGYTVANPNLSPAAAKNPLCKPGDITYDPTKNQQHPSPPDSNLQLPSNIPPEDSPVPPVSSGDDAVIPVNVTSAASGIDYYQSLTYESQGENPVHPPCNCPMRQHATRLQCYTIIKKTVLTIVIAVFCIKTFD